MYYIKKYADCWAVHDDDTGASRKLTEAEKLIAMDKYPELKYNHCRSIYFDDYFLDKGVLKNFSKN